LAAKLSPLFLIPNTSKGSVCCSILADESAESYSGVRARVGAVSIDVSDVNLHGAMVLGLDEPVGGTALTWHVKINGRSLGVLIRESANQRPRTAV